jgi:transposase-like protein
MHEKWPIAYQKMGLLEFQERFPEERECYDYLAKVRFPKGFFCPRCGSSTAGKVATRGLWQCKTCRAQVSITAGTMFHRTRTPLRQWFWAIFLVAKDKRGHSALQLSKELNIPYARAWLMIHKIRSAMAHRDLQYKLDGIVEMDETYFGSPDRGKRGRSTRRTKAIVAVGVTGDNKPRFAKIATVRRLDSRTVKAFARPNIAKGSMIRTDGLNIYRGLAKIGFSHQPTVNPGKADGDLLHWTHVIISNAKAFILGTFHGLGKKHLQDYLNEFCYRFNRRYRDAELFDRLLLACASAPHKSYDELTE